MKENTCPACGAALQEDGTCPLGGSKPGRLRFARGGLISTPTKDSPMVVLNPGLIIAQETVRDLYGDDMLRRINGSPEAETYTLEEVAEEFGIDLEEDE